MKTEWWYDDATFHYSGDKEIHLARLTIHPNGMAEVLTANKRISFPNEESASEWLTDEEFSLLEILTETFEEAGIPIDPRIKVPCATCDGELVEQMLINLGEKDKLLPQ